MHDDAALPSPTAQRMMPPNAALEEEINLLI
jgi:hypothetical protein